MRKDLSQKARDQLLAFREQRSSHVVQRTNSKAAQSTLTKYKQGGESWKKFIVEFRPYITEGDYVCHGGSIPMFGLIQDFLAWTVFTGTPRLGKSSASYYLDTRKSSASRSRRKTSNRYRCGTKSGMKTAREIPTEVERFFNNATIEMHQSPLAWWKANEKAYPVCAAIARDILAIPASAAEPERVHSQVRTVMNWNQTRMGPKTIETSVMVKCSVLYNPSTVYGNLDFHQAKKLYDPQYTIEPSELIQ